MTSTSQSRRPVGPRRSTTPGTACPSGPTTCGLPNSWSSPGAGSVPSVVSVPGPRWWTMWSPTGETGPGSSPGPISRACVSIITTRRPPGSWRKSGETAAETDGQILREATSAPGRGRVCLPGRAQGQAFGLEGGRVKKVLGLFLQDRAAPQMRENLPHQGFGPGVGGDRR